MFTERCFLGILLQESMPKCYRWCINKWRDGMTDQMFGFLAVVLSNIGMFLWVRSEASADRREGQALISSLANDIHTEMKDFHGRLISLEEKHLEIMRKHYESVK